MATDFGAHDVGSYLTGGELLLRMCRALERIGNDNRSAQAIARMSDQVVKELKAMNKELTNVRQELEIQRRVRKKRKNVH